jgi:FAD/FMN-containing dehydrogenase
MGDASVSQYRSWGGGEARPLRVARPRVPSEALAALGARKGMRALAYGCGRSYGDVALNPAGLLIDCRSLDRFIDFDRETGILTCEAGVRLADILALLCRPNADGDGWFPPVSPGTRFVTVGGAIANDVHGKNHHRFGTFGRHVLSLDLARSDGSVRECSPDCEPELFAATIGGLGLTGLILRARLQLRWVNGTAVESEEVRFDELAEFFVLSAESDADWEYTAAWLDCLQPMGRGIFLRARHRPGVGAAPPALVPRHEVPFDLPFSLLNGVSLKLFNTLYYRKSGWAGRTCYIGSYEKVLYPLDGIGRWNRFYGRRGFFQFQCVVPMAEGPEAIGALLREIAASGEGSMLGVLKVFGGLGSPGLLSFPMAGTTLALDFPDRGAATRTLLDRLEHIVSEAGGRIYPAKDSVMSAASFHRGFTQAERFCAQIDPGMSSAFARRIGLVGEKEKA